ncbi:MAG: glycosyltransferase family 4 protein [Nitrospirota bacterium]
MMKERYKVAIISPSPFYYHAKLYQQLAAHPRIELIVYFCTREALDGTYIRRAYGSSKNWGLEHMLEGYNYKFLRNYAPRSTYTKPPFGLVNFGVWNEIKHQKPDAVILQAWTDLTWWLAMFAALRFKIPFFLMTDANALNETEKPQWERLIRRVLLGKIFFPLCSGFLCSGKLNKELYLIHNAAEARLFPFRYSWGYDSFLQVANQLKPQRNQIREQLGIPKNFFVILFSGRLHEMKRPFDLLEAYSRLDFHNKALVFVGDGELRRSLQKNVITHNFEYIFFFGFQRRDEIAKFYAAADLLVLPSSAETWGIVVNEAMCFSLPVIVSGKVGAAADLIKHGENGFVFPCGDVEALVYCIRHIMELPEDKRLAMGAKSLSLIQQWCAFKPDEALVEILDTVLRTEMCT